MGTLCPVTDVANGAIEQDAVLVASGKDTRVGEGLTVGHAVAEGLGPDESVDLGARRARVQGRAAQVEVVAGATAVGEGLILVV
jgi:hypothetical protein